MIAGYEAVLQDLQPDDAWRCKPLLDLLCSVESCDHETQGLLQAEPENLLGHQLKLYLKAAFVLMLTRF